MKVLIQTKEFLQVLQFLKKLCIIDVIFYIDTQAEIKILNEKHCIYITFKSSDVIERHYENFEIDLQTLLKVVHSIKDDTFILMKNDEQYIHINEYSLFLNEMSQTHIIDLPHLKYDVVLPLEYTDYKALCQRLAFLRTNMIQVIAEDELLHFKIDTQHIKFLKTFRIEPAEVHKEITYHTLCAFLKLKNQQIKMCFDDQLMNCFILENENMSLHYYFA